jgi:copper chaperone CopZ
MSNKQITLSISDMHCQSCPKLVKTTLSEIPGVISTTTSLDTKQAIVDYDENAVSVDQLIKAIGEIGYTAKIK